MRIELKNFRWEYRENYYMKKLKKNSRNSREFFVNNRTSIGNLNERIIKI